jgi:hypothetical protein
MLVVGNVVLAAYSVDHKVSCLAVLHEEEVEEAVVDLVVMVAKLEVYHSHPCPELSDDHQGRNCRHAVVVVYQSM